MHLKAIITLLKINYNSKGQVAPPKHLFYAVTEIEKDLYTLIEQSAYYALFMWQLITSQS